MGGCLLPSDHLGWPEEANTCHLWQEPVWEHVWFGRANMSICTALTSASCPPFCLGAHSTVTLVVVERPVSSGLCTRTVERCSYIYILKWNYYRLLLWQLCGRKNSSKLKIWKPINQSVNFFLKQRAFEYLYVPVILPGAPKHESACWSGRLCGRWLPPRIALLFFNSIFNNCGWERHWESEKSEKKMYSFHPPYVTWLSSWDEHRLLVSRNMNENSRSFYFFHFFFSYTAVQVNVRERPRHSWQPLAMLRIM